MFTFSETRGYQESSSVIRGFYQRSEFNLLRDEWIPPSPLAVRWQIGKNSPGDVIWTMPAVPVIINSSVVVLLQDSSFTGWFTYPVVIYDQNRNTVAGYFGLSVGA